MANDLRVTASIQDNLSPGLNQITQNLGRQTRAAESAKRGLRDLLGQANNTKQAMSAMVDSIRAGNFVSFGQQAMAAASSMGGLTAAMRTATGAAGGLGAAMSASLGPIGLIISAIAAVGAVTVSAVKSASEFENHLDGLQSLTGLDDSAMRDIADAAVDMSKNFRSSAGEIVDSMKLIGSQAPELLKDKDALMEVTEAANVLAEAALIDVVDAARGITTTMNQMGASAAEAKEIINTLAAASQLGSADVAYLNAAFEKAGTQARAAGMSYTQLAAAIETVGPKFSSAEVAGTKLNSTLLALSVQTNDNFKPAVVGMQLALENLAQAELTDAQMKELVGASQISMLKALIEGKDTFSEYSQSLANTLTAYDQMRINNDNLDGSLTRLKSAWDAAMLSIGQSSVIQFIIDVLSEWASTIAECINYVSDLLSSITELEGGVSIIDMIGTAFRLLAIPCKMAWELIAVASSAIVKLINSILDAVRYVWTLMKNVMSDMGIFEPIKNGCLQVLTWFENMIRGIKKLWNDFKRWLGMSVKDMGVDSKTINKLQKDVKTTLTQQNYQTTLTTGQRDKQQKLKTKVEFDEGSLDYLKDRLQKLQKTITSKKLSVIDLQKTRNEIRDLEQQIEDKEIELGIKPKRGSLEYIQSKINDIDRQIKQLNPLIDFAEINELKALKEALQDLKKQVENELSEVVVVGKKFKTEGMEGSLQEAQDKVQWYRARLNVEVEGSEDYNYLMGKLKEWRQKEEQIKLNMELELSEAEPGSLQFIKDRQQYWNSKLQLSAYGTPEFKEAQKELAKLTKEEQKITVKMEFDGLNDLSKFGAMFDTAIAQPLEAADNVVNSIDKLTRSIKDGANEWEIFMGYISVGMSIFQGLESIMNVINTLSLLFASTSAKNAAATSAEASARTANSSAMVAETGTLSGLMATETAAVAPSLALTAATKQLAASQIFLAHAAIPFVGTSIAAGMVAEMEAVMAAIAAAGAFANGGIISAPTSIGDYALARVNGGEMILNSRQQGNLFNAIDKNRLYDTPGNIVAGEVKVKGTDLYIALKNLARTKSALGKNIGIK